MHRESRGRVDRLESDLLRHASGDDPPGLVPHWSSARCILARRGVVDRDGLDRRRGRYITPFLTER